MELEERIVELESKIAFLENYIHELNDVVISQERRINTLADETEKLKKQMASVREAFPESEKPPHY